MKTCSDLKTWFEKLKITNFKKKVKMSPKFEILGYPVMNMSNIDPVICKCIKKEVGRQLNICSFLV